MATCDLETLIDQACENKFTCLVDERVRRAVKLQFLCNLSDAPPLTPPDPIVAEAADNITTTGFSAHWASSPEAVSYRLDVATDAAFTQILPLYDNVTVVGLSQSVSGLSTGTDYYYRVRVVNGGGTSVDSNVITVTTDPSPLLLNLFEAWDFQSVDGGNNFIGLVNSSALNATGSVAPVAGGIHNNCANGTGDGDAVDLSSISWVFSNENTFSFWFKQTTLNDGSLFGDISDGPNGWNVLIEGGEIKFQDSNFAVIIDTNITVIADTWYNIVGSCTINGPTFDISMWVNGVEFTGTGAVLAYSNSLSVFGSPMGPFITALVDELYLWNYTLPDDLAVQLWSGGTGEFYPF